MEIHAKIKLDYETLNTTTYSLMCRGKKTWIVQTCTYVFTFVFLILAIGLAIVLEINEISYYALLIVFALIQGKKIYRYHTLPRKRYNLLGKLKDIETEIVFGDEMVKCTTKNEVFSEVEEFAYSMIVKVIEMPYYFGVYITHKDILFVDKRTIKNGTIIELREKLMQYVAQNNYKFYQS